MSDSKIRIKKKLEGEDTTPLDTKFGKKPTYGARAIHKRRKLHFCRHHLRSHFTFNLFSSHNPKQGWPIKVWCDENIFSNLIYTFNPFHLVCKCIHCTDCRVETDANNPYQIQRWLNEVRNCVPNTLGVIWISWSGLTVVPYRHKTHI